jgi:DNA topoisomerase I
VPRLRRSDCAAPGIRRRGRGRGFEYLDPDGDRIDDPETLERIADLAVPPAWRDVWICPWPNGHIQAIGIDAAGRRQYRYHDAWRTNRDALKHERVLEIARQLPDVRDAVVAAIEGEGLTRDRVLAAAIRLLDLGAFRVGSEQYAEDNGTFGLATLRRDHVHVRGEKVSFSFTAKGGLERELAIVDEPTAAVVRELVRRPDATAPDATGADDTDEDLLGYWLDDGSWHDVTSAEINSYLKEISGAEFTAKDFRTWSATVEMAAILAEQEPVPATKTGRKKAIKAAYEQVSETLGNTPAVCKASYVDPRVVDRFERGETIHASLRQACKAKSDRDHQRLLEAGVCALLSA